MELELGQTIVLGGVSALAAILGSMLGLGGGVFLVPIFTLFFGVDQKIAIGASAVAVVTNSVVGSTVHLGSRFTNLRLAMLLQVTTAAGATIGALIAVIANPRFVNAVFGFLLMYAAVSMLKRRSGVPAGLPMVSTDDAGPGAPAPDRLRLGATFRDPAIRGNVSYRPHRIGAGIGISGVAGTLSGILGIGGGVIQVPAMSILMRVPVKAAAGTSSFMVGFAAVATSAVFYAEGLIDPRVVVPAMIGIFVGSQIGPRLTRRIPTERLVLIFVAILLYLGVSLLLRAVGVELPGQR